MTSSSRTAVRRCSYADLEAFPDLFVDYCRAYDRVADFYAGDWRERAEWQAAADRAARRPVDRDPLADILREQNEAWGAGGATLKNIEALRDPETVAVVTGQQVGLFTGPLYTIYKTITTLQLAQALAAETGRTVVPVFWVEGEDHDADEIARTHILQHNEVVPLEYEVPEPPEGQNHGAVGRYSLAEGPLQAVLDRLDEALPPSDFKPAVMEHIRAAYQPGASIEDAFARLQHVLFDEEGLVCINPDDARLKSLTRPLFRREIESPRAPAARIEATSQALRDQGYHAQVRARPTNLFWLGEAGRQAIDLGEDGTFVLRGGDWTPTRDELLDRLEAEPERFSPNVVLRPLMQDVLLPTTAYVAGPGEVSYFAQYGEVYEWANVDMPLIYPRASVSLVEGKVQKVLDKYDLSVPDLSTDLDMLFQEVVLDAMEVDVDAIFEDAMRDLHRAVNDLKPNVEAVDRSLVSSVEATRSALANEMEELKQKVVRAEKRQQDEVHAQLGKAHVNLRPEGALQERTINVLYFLNKYSLGLLDELNDALSTDTSEHQVVQL